MQNRHGGVAKQIGKSCFVFRKDLIQQGNDLPLIAPGTAYNRLKALLKETGLPDIRFHDLRHTFATHALSSGVDAKTLAGILGHTKASFTLDTYTHTTGDMQKRAAEIVGGFLTDYLGEEMNPWQSRENTAAAPSV